MAICRCIIPKAACFWILGEGHSASRLCALACSLVPLGRVRASRLVSTRPRRPFPLYFALQSLISKRQWYYSSVSFWEIALKRSTKGFDFEIEDDWDILFPRELQRLDVLRIDLESTDCRAVEMLDFHHRDPFDRMLIAQAIQRRIGIISRDVAFDPYDVIRAW